MIHKEEYMRYFITNSKNKDKSLYIMNNYQYALSLTPKHASFHKKPKRACVQDNGVYRLNVYPYKIMPKIPEPGVKTFNRFQIKEFPTGTKIEFHNSLLPKIKSTPKPSRPLKKKLSENYYDLGSKEKSELTDFYIQDNKVYKDIGLNTDY
jgi:hypothetical protein